VIGLAAERFTKNLWTDRALGTKPQLASVRDEADQARFIVERVLENREVGTLLKQQAVLFRTSSHSGPLEIELTRRNIPFVKFGGLAKQTTLIGAEPASRASLSGAADVRDGSKVDVKSVND
jgi:DNA helicase II / ATP-dependent DNA helicase PcrA